MLKPHFRAAVKDGGALELSIYDDIGENPWTGGGVSAKAVKQQLDKSAGNFGRISVRINSPGGDAFEGVAIGNLLQSAGVPVDVFVDGIAASAASIIAMAGTTRTMAKNAMMMIHNAWGFCAGNAADMAKTADTLNKVSESIANTYTETTGKSLAEIKTMMDDETWMGADDCVKHGFATAITPSGDNKALAMASGFKTLSKFRHTPESLKADSTPCDCECQECRDGDCGACTHVGCQCPGCEECGAQAEAKAAKKKKKSDPADEAETTKAADSLAAKTAADQRARELQLMRMRTI